jgi:hypothetical protein
MTFFRSRTGIQNRNLFTRTNFTVYIETSAEEYKRNSLDIVFWRAFFSRYYPSSTVRFVPLGGKRQVEAMADL